MIPSEEHLRDHGRSRRRLRAEHAAILWAVLLLPLCDWGLPDRSDDARLFGGQTWSAERWKQALEAAPAAADTRGADVDADPIADRTTIVHLTPDAAARSAILLRYRLYSRQPDEMITFRALQRMRPRQLDFDPHLYQYGGAWIYGVGAVIGAASLLKLAVVSGDLTVYLSQPELFARFYLIARLVTLAFAAGGLVAVARIGQFTGRRSAGWIAMLLVAFSPVYLSGALECKPHVPSACMLLWAILAALRWQRDHLRRDAARLGLFGGLAAGFVLTGFAAALIWPALWIATRADDKRRAARHLIAAAVIAGAVYSATNPYVPYNVVFNRGALTGNLSNSTAMYSISRLAEGAWRVAELSFESVGPIVLLVGLLGAAAAVVRAPRASLPSAFVGAGLTLLLAAIGAGKPGEFARFLLLPMALLSIAAAALLAEIGQRSRLGGLAAVALALALGGSHRYLDSFADEHSRTGSTRTIASEHLAAEMSPTDRVGLLQEPAPYSIPPLDFARRTIVLLPRDRPSDLDQAALPEWIVATVDSWDDGRPQTWWSERYRLHAALGRWRPGSATVITWANKPVLVFRRID